METGVSFMMGLSCIIPVCIRREQGWLHGRPS
jgi:hypothetical protein